MNIRRLIGILLLAAGIAILFYANFQKGRIAEASKSANEKINKGQSLFQENPVSEAVGSMVGKSMHEKVSTEVEKYRAMVMWLTIAGIIVGVIGLGMTIFSKNKRKS